MSSPATATLFILTSALCAGSLILPATASAQESSRPPPDIARFSPFEPSAGLGMTEGELQLPPIGVGTGFNGLDRDSGETDAFLLLRFYTAFKLWRFGAGLNLDLQVDDDGQIREEDFDEPSDWFRVVDYIRFGEPGDFFHARVGKLRDYSVGHGTIMGHYYSDTDLDSPKSGGAAGFDLGWWGAQYVTSDVSLFNLQVGRVYMRPLSDLGIPVLDNLAVGVTVGVDITAPRKLIDVGGGQVEVDSDGNLKAREDPLVVYGADLELPLFTGLLWDVTPYADYNHIVGHGTGGHFGMVTRVALPFAVETDLIARAEFRIFQSEYIPTYFDTFYEIERFRFPDLADPSTKRDAIDEQSAAKGWYGELRWVVPNLVEVSASYEDSDKNQNDSLDAYVQFTAVEWLRLRAHYHKRNITDYERVFSFDDQTFLSAHLLFKIYSGLYADVSFTRTWVFDEDDQRFRPVDVYSPGIMFIVEF